MQSNYYFNYTTEDDQKFEDRWKKSEGEFLVHFSVSNEPIKNLNFPSFVSMS